jgi:hypothetical protein
MLRSALAVTAAICTACAANTAIGQERPEPCGPRAEVVGQLAGNYGEEQHSVGLADQNLGLVELYVDPHDQSWTVVLSKPDGSACLIASGTAWGGPLHKPGAPT